MPSFWCVELVVYNDAPVWVALAPADRIGSPVAAAVAITWFFLHVANCCNRIGSADADLSYHVVLAYRQTVARGLVPS